LKNNIKETTERMNVPYFMKEINGLIREFKSRRSKRMNPQHLKSKRGVGSEYGISVSDRILKS
jgi:hypothetical protein